MSGGAAGSRLRGAAHLLAMPALPLRARLALVALAARRKAGRGGATAWDFGLGRVRLGPPSERDVDWRVLSEIFVSEVYAADFAGSAVIDAGAHKGYFGAYALASGAAAVISIEPESRNFAALAEAAESVSAPGRTWTARRAAVGPVAGRAALQVAPESWSHRTVAGAAASAGAATEEVPVVALAALLDEARARGCRRLVVKLDVEGDECAIVRGTPPDAWSGVDDLFVEAHAFAPCGPEELRHRLGRAGLRHVDTRRGDVLRFQPGGRDRASAT